MTSSDTRAFSLAAALILAASGLRFGVEVARGGPGMGWDTAAALPRLLEDSRSATEREALRKTPLAPGETLDPNRATADQLDRLPGVGPGTAIAIVEHRKEGGVYASPEALLDVRGVGPGTLAKMRPHLVFAAARAASRPAREDRTRRGAGAPAVARASTRRVDLNRADASELEVLPGVGPALARRILAERTRRGRFRTVDDLAEVRGIGSATVERLRPLVTARPR